MTNVFTESEERAMVVDAEHSWFERAGARLMGGINIGSGQFNLANFLSIIAVGAVLWFGSLVTGDHDKINDIAASVKNLNVIQDQLTTTNTLIIGFQHDQAEIRARLDCIQNIGSIENCRIPRRQR